MGHTDFPGLGGATINTVTQEEILGVASLTDDGMLHLASLDVEDAAGGETQRYPSASVSIAEIDAVARDASKVGTAVWDPAVWTSYIKGALAHMLSPRCGFSALVRERLGLSRADGEQRYVVVGGDI
jgi:hypothetical protein